MVHELAFSLHVLEDFIETERTDWNSFTYNCFQLVIAS